MASQEGGNDGNPEVRRQTPRNRRRTKVRESSGWSKKKVAVDVTERQDKVV